MELKQTQNDQRLERRKKNNNIKNEASKSDQFISIVQRARQYAYDFHIFIVCSDLHSIFFLSITDLFI